MADGSSSILRAIFFGSLFVWLILLLVSNYPAAGIFLYSLGFSFAPASVENMEPQGVYDLEASLPDCLGVSTNWHYFSVATPELEELFVSCVTADGELAIKRIDLSDYSDSEIILTTGVPTSSSIFAYLSVSICRTAHGYVIGTVIPRADLGSTTFFATVLNLSGVLQGSVGTTLPGARANRQAFFCRNTETLAQFIYHGAGETVGETDTFVIQVSDSATTSAPVGLNQVVMHRVTENRETDLADAIPVEIVDGTNDTVIRMVYKGLQPVAEIDLDSDGDGSESEVRYGGIVVPIVFDTLETGDLRNWSSAVTN